MTWGGGGSLVICFYQAWGLHELFHFWHIIELNIKAKLNTASNISATIWIPARSNQTTPVYPTCQLITCHYSWSSKSVIILALSALKSILKSAFNNRELGCCYCRLCHIHFPESWRCKPYKPASLNKPVYLVLCWTCAPDANISLTRWDGNSLNHSNALLETPCTLTCTHTCSSR